jgi:hypothetical protein
MELLNLVEKLEVGQKVHSTQLGPCEVISIDSAEIGYPIALQDVNGRVLNYTKFGQYVDNDVLLSIFLTEPTIFTFYAE